MAEVGLEPGLSDPETYTLPLSYQADDEEICFAWIQITNISIYVVKNASLSDLNDEYSNGIKTKHLFNIFQRALLLLKKKFYKNNMAAH